MTFEEVHDLQTAMRYQEDEDNLLFVDDVVNRKSTMLVFMSYVITFTAIVLQFDSVIADKYENTTFVNSTTE